MKLEATTLAACRIIDLVKKFFHTPVNPVLLGVIIPDLEDLTTVWTVGPNIQMEFRSLFIGIKARFHRVYRLNSVVARSVIPDLLEV